VGAEGVAFERVEGAFEQGAEDGGFDLGPVGAGGFEQQVDLVAVERQNLGLLEQLAVEARQGARMATENRLRPWLSRGRRRAGRIVAGRLAGFRAGR
jgi:hypothetical protein